MLVRDFEVTGRVPNKLPGEGSRCATSRNASSRQSAPGGLRACRRPACRAGRKVNLGPQADMGSMGAESAGHATHSYTYRVRIIRRLNPLPVEEEPHARDVLALTVAEGVHELFELRGALDLEEDFVVVVSDFNV